MIIRFGDQKHTQLTHHDSDGASSKSLPITVATGSGATFKADLRLRVQVGAEAAIDSFGIGAGAAMGIYANLVEFVAEIETTPTCALETREWFDLNAGAYARLDVVVDYKTLGLVPTVSTTLLSAPTLTQCWIPGQSSGSAGPGLTMTSPPLSMTAAPGLSMPASALPMVSSSASISTSSVSPTVESSPSSTASLTAKYATSAVKESSPLSSAVPSLAPPLSLNGTGRYLMVQSSQASVSGSQAASSSSPSSSPSVSGVSASLSTYPGFLTTMSPPLSTGVPSVVASPLSMNGTGRYPLLNASSLTNETELVTTTLYSTSAYTITMCAAGVPNCPAAYQKEVAVTKTVDSYTTVCPAGAQVTWPTAAEVGGEAAPTSAAAGPVTSHRVVTQVVAMTAVPSPKPETFVPPPVPAPTAAAVVAVAAVGESGSASAPSRPAAAAAYAAFMADYGVDNAGPSNTTLATPSPSSSSSSSSGSDHAGYPVAAADGAASLAQTFKHKTILQENSTSHEEQHSAPVTAGAIASYAENIGLVLGSVMVTVLLLG